jgi:hypothetical protein
MDLAPGVHVTENIRLKRRLGEGGMASVWVGEHLTLRIDVAVKFIAPELIGQAPDLVARFNREATAVAKIRSPHVVQVLDHGMTSDGTPYIVMELLEGEDLGARLDREGSLPLHDVVTIVGQVGKALSRAHAAGIVHRDIKPDNLFLVRSDEDGELFVKVLDFGIAKDTRQTSYSVVTVTGTMVGTPAYMSPEQILSGKHVDSRADLWSLGVVAYHAMTGEVPFEGSTLGALCVAISRGVFQDPSYLAPHLPRAIDAWMTRALSLAPDDRFSSAKELVDSFREAASSQAPAADEVGAFSRPSADFGLGGTAPDEWEPPPSSSVPPGLRGAPTFTGAGAMTAPVRRFVPRAVLVGGIALATGIVATAAITRSRGVATEPSLGASGVLAAPSTKMAAPLEERSNREAERAPSSAEAADAPAPSVSAEPVEDAPTVESEGTLRSPSMGSRRPRPNPRGSLEPRDDRAPTAASAIERPAASPPAVSPPVPEPDGAATPVDRGF